MAVPKAVQELLAKVRHIRERSEISPKQLEEQLILGPGWVERFESGEVVPTVDVLLAMLHTLGSSLAEIDADEQEPAASGFGIDRYIFAEPAAENPNDLLVQFRYTDYDATYRLANATIDQFDAVLREMRDGLARLVNMPEDSDKAIKVAAVARTFLRAASLWTAANPSDLWWFVVNRAYCDPFNHPARYARLSLEQSWKRTSGWALEEIFVSHYGPFLREHGINMLIAPLERRRNLLRQLRVSHRLEADKVDVLLTALVDGVERCFGVCHVKASFAERRTDDVPMSRALVEAGYCSPLLTMDCKSSPSASPVNRGELGQVLETMLDPRSAKRKDIEDDGYFSACFSFNSNTIPTPEAQNAAARIYVCNFRNPDDQFSRFVIDRWKAFRASHLAGG